jgi:alpha-ketoglutarate-dependent taurine dioxygenase
MSAKLTRNSPFGVVVEPLEAHLPITDLDVEWLRELFQKEHLIVLRGFAPFSETDAFSDWCERFGEIALWPFGKVLNLQERANPEDHIFDNSYIPLHWDGMYRPHVPEYQIFHCVNAPISEEGGRTTFSNTIGVLERASASERRLWEKVTGTYKRVMEFYDSRTVSPIITKHPYRDYSVIRYNEPHREERGRFVNPPQLHFSGISEEEVARFHDSLRSALYAPENFYAHEWRQGDVVIADNFSLLHGREEFVSKSPRHLWRVQAQSQPPLDNPGLEWHR